ncbi:MAG TPA: hypothetical protein VGO59_07900 [Verrucomicrobiae bacterium]
MSMKSGQTTARKQAFSAALGCAMIGGWVASASANPIPVTVSDITDWSTTPVEIIDADLPYLGREDCAIYAGINTLSVNLDGTTTIYSGFCIDPFHWSASGPISGYYEVPLSQAPKFPGTMNAATATAIGDLWAEYFSPTMSSSSAAGLQIAIWELVSANAVASGELSPSLAFSLTAGQYDYGASQDLASLAQYNGPTANVIGLTGPGQDYVVDPPRQGVPDGGRTLMMLALALGGIAAARLSPQLAPAPQKARRR